MDFTIRGLVARMLQSMPAQPDGGDSGVFGTRMGKYNEVYTMTPLPPKQVLADEGAYFTANNAQAGLALNISATGFLSAVPYLMVYNGAQPSAAGTRVYFDYATLSTTATGVSGSNVQIAIVTDTGNRYVSGGTNLTSNIVLANQDSGMRSQCQVYCGVLAVSTPTGTARTVVGNRMLSSGSPVIGDEYSILFGPTDIQQQINISTIKKTTDSVPPIVIGPNQSMLLYVWEPTMATTGSAYAPEVGWVER